MNEIAQLVVQNIGAITVTGGFLWYLSKRDKEFGENLKTLNKSLKDHMSIDIKVQKEIAKSLVKINDRLDDK